MKRRDARIEFRNHGEKIDVDFTADVDQEDFCRAMSRVIWRVTGGDFDMSIRILDQLRGGLCRLRADGASP